MMYEELVKRLRDYEQNGLGAISPYEAGNIADAIEKLSKTVVRGEWLDEPGHIPHCSICGRYSEDADSGEAICCPFCGAEMVGNVPPTDTKPVWSATWEWDPDGMDWNIGAWKCSHCRVRPETWWATVGNVHPLLCSGSRFCGNCGADMRR